MLGFRRNFCQRNLKKGKNSMSIVRYFISGMLIICSLIIGCGGGFGPDSDGASDIEEPIFGVGKDSL